MLKSFKIPSTFSNPPVQRGQLPLDSIITIDTVTTIIQRDALDRQSGDKCIVTDTNTCYVYDGTEWIALPSTTAHGELTDIGTNTHAQIDSHIANSTLHFTKASISHNDILDKGTNTHTAIDSHIANSTVHFTKASISHNDILDKGTNTHAQIDTHMVDNTIHRDNNTSFVFLGNYSGVNCNWNEIAIGQYSGNKSSYTAGNFNCYIGDTAGSSSVGSGNLFIGGYGAGPYDADVSHANCIGSFAGKDTCHNNCNIINATGANLNSAQASSSYMAPIRNLAGSSILQYNNTTKEITHGAIAHTALSSIGTNTHAQIDTHIARTTIHYTKDTISHTEIQDIGTLTHAQIDNHVVVVGDHIADSTLHFTKESITIADLADTTITAPSEGQVLSYDNATSKFINTTPSSFTPYFTTIRSSALGTVNATIVGNQTLFTWTAPYTGLYICNVLIHGFSIYPFAIRYMRSWLEIDGVKDNNTMFGAHDRPTHTNNMCLHEMCNGATKQNHHEFYSSYVNITAGAVLNLKVEQFNPDSWEVSLDTTNGGSSMSLIRLS